MIPSITRSSRWCFWTLFLLLALPLTLAGNSKISSAPNEGFDPKFFSRVIYAVNAGGNEHIDSWGVHYQADPLVSQGISSDYGKRIFRIGRVDPSDDYLYQTERYGLNTFSYKIPKVIEDGDYVLVLKFCEVYFLNPNKKVFGVRLNGIQIVHELDIFDNVGFGVAHDEMVQLKVSGKGTKLQIGNKQAKILKNTLELEFVKGELDNPKINAFYLARGVLADFPQLPPFDKEEQDQYDKEQLQMQDQSNVLDEEDMWSPDTPEDDDDVEPWTRQRKPKRHSPGLPLPFDPEEEDSLSYMYPILVSGVVALISVWIVKKIVL